MQKVIVNIAICIVIATVAFLSGYLVARRDNRTTTPDNLSVSATERIVALTREYFARREVELAERERGIRERESRLERLEGITESGRLGTEEIERLARETITIAESMRANQQD